MTNLLRWLRALRWPEELGTFTFSELGLDFEESSERTLPAGYQQGSLHRESHMTRCGALIPPGGRAVCGLNWRPYLTFRQKMIRHICTLTQSCEATWIARSHTRPAAQRPYVYRARKTPEQVEEARLQRALTGSLNTSLMPAADTQRRLQQTLCQRPFSGHRGRQSPAGPIHHSHKQVARSHTLRGRTAKGNGHMGTSHTPATCRRLHSTAETCCSMLHHTPGHVARLPMLQRCAQHNLPPCPRCMVTRRGVRHCCGSGHHKVITPRRLDTRACPTDNQGPPPKKRRAIS